MSFTIQLVIRRTADVKPPVNEIVAVNGGVASWNGVEWLSVADSYKPIPSWAVKWWMYLPTDEQVSKAENET